MTSKNMGTTLGERAPERVNEIPTALVVEVAAAPSDGKRQLYEWSIDSYDTVTVRVYGPEGESLPEDTDDKGKKLGFMTLTGDDFDYRSLDRQSRVALLHNEHGPLDTWFTRVDAPKTAIIDSVRITLA